MVNLIDEKSQKEQRARYYRALANSLLSLLSFALAVALALHVPLYLSAIGEETDVLQNLGIVRERADTLTKQTSATSSAAAKEEVRFGIQLQREPVVERAVGALVVSLPKGVSISKIDVKLLSLGGVEVSARGRAPSRDSLTKLETDIRAVAGVKDERIPVAAFVEERDRDFTITYSYLPPKK